MVFKIPKSITRRFTSEEINQGLFYADRVARGKPLFQVPGKKVFDALHSFATFKRLVLKGQLARRGLELTTFQKIRERKKQEKLPQQILTQRQIGIVPGTKVPIRETIVASEQGAFIRKATSREAEQFRKGTRTLEVPGRQTAAQKDIQELRRIQEKQRRGKSISPVERVRIAGLTLSLTGRGFIVGIGQTLALIPKLPGGIISLIKQPGQIKKIPTKLSKIPSSIKKFGVKEAKLLRVSPDTVLAQIGSEIIIMTATGGVLKVTGKLGAKASSKVGNLLRGVKVSKTRILISQGKKKAINIKIVGRIGSKTLPKETLAKQLKLAGKKVTGVSAQADKLIGIIKKKRIIRKPIPNEIKLSKLSKNLLKKFDSGKITKKQLIRLERRIKRESGQSLLERSFFADPRGRIRPSRLGTKQKEASLFETLTGEVSFKTPKPQVLVFRDVKIQNLPQTEIFEIIKRKLRAKKTLTTKEADALLKFQLKKSGEFKPIGALSKESEITLAPGEIIKKVKKLGSFIQDGKKVNIIQAEVIKVSGRTKKLLEKFKKGTRLSKKEIKELNKLVKKRSKGLQSVSVKRVGKKFFPLKRKLTSGVLSKLRQPGKRLFRPKRIFRTKEQVRAERLKNLEKARRVKTQATKRRKIKKVERAIPKRTQRPIIKRPAKKTIPRPAPRIPPRIATIPKTIPRISKKKVGRKKRKPQQAYNVFARPTKKRKGQKRSKLIKVLNRPIGKKSAKDVRNFVIDRSLSRSGSIRKVKGKPGKRPKIVPKSYAKKTKQKFRNFRISKGKRIPLRKGRVIERKKFVGDTKSEIRGLTLRRIKKRINKPVRTKKELRNFRIENLKKARKILAKKRK